MPDDKLTPHKTTAASMRCVLKERVGHLYLFRVAGTTRLIPVRVTDFWGATEGETMTIYSTVIPGRALEIGVSDGGREIVLDIYQNGRHKESLIVKASDIHTFFGIDETVKRAETAEAVIARIREALADPRQGYPAIHNILNPTPPFELPTTVPARVTAKRHGGEERTFYLWTNGTGGTNDNLWIDEDNWGRALTGGELMDRYTDHRVLDSAA